MEYVYAVLLLHKLGKEINEENITKILSSIGVEVNESKVKSLVASLEGVDIESELANVSVSSSTSTSSEAVKEEKKEEKRTEESVAGLSALFG